MLVFIRILLLFFRVFRDLKYVTVFSEFHGKSYSYLLKQKLPAGVYVSTDQLEDLKRFEKVSQMNFNLHSTKQNYQTHIPHRSTTMWMKNELILKSQWNNQNHFLSIYLVTPA